MTAHNTAGSSVAEYPFATLTLQGATVQPPPKGSSREKSTSKTTTTTAKTTTTSTFFYAFKIIAVLFLSCSILVASFYIAVFTRKWKRKRADFNDISMDRRPFRVHSSPLPMESSRFSSNGGTLQRPVQDAEEDQSPMLPPNTFRAVPANCPVAAVTAAGSNIYLGSPSKEICPFVTEQQVTLKLHPIEATFCPVAFEGHSFQTHEPLYATLLGRHRDFPSREELAGNDGKRLVSLHVADTKYDSDSDFDYRQPRRRPPRGRGYHRRPASQSSTSSEDDSVSPLPRVRSIEALEGGMRSEFWHRRNLQRDPPAQHIMFGSSLGFPQASPKTTGSLKRVRQIHV